MRGLPRELWVAGGGALATLLACFAPWLSAFSVSLSGFQVGNGKVVAGLAAAALGALALFAVTAARGWPLAALLFGLTAFSIAVYDVTRLGGQGDEANILGERVDLVQLGWGLYVALAASIVLTVGAYLLQRLPAD